MDSITADEARDYQPSNKGNSFIKEINEQIKEAAMSDRSSIRLRYHHLGNYKFAFSNGLTLKDIKKHYTEKGFFVTEYYEGRQLVDAGVEISWAKIDTESK